MKPATKPKVGIKSYLTPIKINAERKDEREIQNNPDIKSFIKSANKKKQTAGNVILLRKGKTIYKLIGVRNRSLVNQKEVIGEHGATKG